jgi:hypothetical protein
VELSFNRRLLRFWKGFGERDRRMRRVGHPDFPKTSTSRKAGKKSSGNFSCLTHIIPFLFNVPQHFRIQMAGVILSIPHFLEKVIPWPWSDTSESLSWSWPILPHFTFTFFYFTMSRSSFSSLL